MQHRHHRKHQRDSDHPARDQSRDVSLKKSDRQPHRRHGDQRSRLKPDRIRQRELKRHARAFNDPYHHRQHDRRRTAPPSLRASEFPPPEPGVLSRDGDGDVNADPVSEHDQHSGIQTPDTPSRAESAKFAGLRFGFRFAPLPCFCIHPVLSTKRPPLLRRLDAGRRRGRRRRLRFLPIPLFDHFFIAEPDHRRAIGHTEFLAAVFAFRHA